MLCIHNEYAKQKHKSIRKVLRINAQKLLYALTFFATAIKGIYFFTKVSWCFFFFEKGLTLGNPVLILGIRFLVAANVLLMSNDLRKKWKRFIISKLQIELEYRVSVGFGKIRNSHCAIDCKLNFIGDNFICQLTRY